MRKSVTSGSSQVVYGFILDVFITMKTRGSAVAEGPSLSDTLDWRSLEMTPFDRTHVLLLTFNSNYGFILHCFSIFHFEEHCDFEIRVRGHSRSSKVLPF